MTAPSRPGVSGKIVALAWGVTLLLALFGVAPWLQARAEGIESRQIAIELTLACGVALLASLVLTVLWARRLGDTSDESEVTGLGRRRFLTGAAVSLGGVAGTIGAVLLKQRGWFWVANTYFVSQAPRTAPNAHPSWEGARVRAYRRLGRTDFQVSDICLGTGRINLENDGENIGRAAIERGVNYFDTAPDYSGYGSEIAMGRAMKGQRDKMFVATKFCVQDGHLNAGASVEEYIQAVEGSLERLQTDHVDLVHIHSCDTVERLMDENAHIAFDKLKEQGKVRFLGVSSHTPNLEEVANAAIDSDRFDVMMLAYHHGRWPSQVEIIERAHAKDIAIVAMKTLKGAEHRGMAEFREHADAYSQAAFKWVLSNPHVSCLVTSFFEHQHLDEYLTASGKPLTRQDEAILEHYDQLIAGRYCFPHCGSCLDACPEGLAINDVLRHRMYFENYGDQKEAMRLYANLEKQADVCMGCSAPCVGACPHGVPIQERTTEAHRMLTFL